MSSFIDDPLPVVAFGETGWGKTTDIMAVAAPAAGQVAVCLTPKRSNLTSVERTLGLPVKDYFTITPCNYLRDVNVFLKKHGRACNIIVVDDLGRMCKATSLMAMATPGPFTKPNREGTEIINKWDAYAFMTAQVDELCLLIEELSAAGVQLYFSSHEVDIKEKSEPGQDAKIISKPHSLGPELTHIPPIATFMKAMKIGVRVMADSRCPLPWKGSYACDRFDTYYIMKDSLAVFRTRGPQNLAEHFRHAGRTAPRYAGFEWMEGWVEELAGYMLDGMTVAKATAWLDGQPDLAGVQPPHIQWILRDAYARAFLRAKPGVVIK